MANSGEAIRKLEETVDKVNESGRDQTASSNDGEEEKLTPIQVRQMMKSFEILDEDNSKGLDIDELGQAFRIMGQNPTKKELQAILKEADLDADGKIDSDEFTRLLIRNMQSTEEVENEMRRAFGVFDTHGDGTVDMEDLISALKVCGDEPLTDDEAEDLVKMMDKNNDGAIQREEFVKFMCKSIPVRFYMIKT